METFKETQSGSEQPSDQPWDEPLDPQFCEAVFGRQLTQKELEEKNRNILVADLDAAVSAIRQYPDWQVYLAGEELLRMKVAVAMLPNQDPIRSQILFLRQDMDL